TSLTKLKSTPALLLALISISAGLGWSLARAPGKDKVSKTSPAFPAAQEIQRNADTGDGQPAAKRDRFGDPLPAHAIARLGTIRLKHGAGTWSVVFSPDGQRIASASNSFNPLIRIWDASTGEATGAIDVGAPAQARDSTTANGVMALAYAADGTMLAGGSYGINRARVWDTGTGKFLQSYPEHHEGVTCVAFSPDDK